MIKRTTFAVLKSQYVCKCLINKRYKLLSYEKGNKKQIADQGGA